MRAGLASQAENDHANDYSKGCAFFSGVLEWRTLTFTMTDRTKVIDKGLNSVSNTMETI